MTKQNAKILADLYLSENVRKYPSVPVTHMGTKKYSDKTANGLTKCIKDFLNFSGQQAERISTTGRMLDNRTTFVDVVGRNRVIGSAKYIKGTSTNGSADISATIKGKSVKIEVKIGRDKQSEAQIKYQENIEKAGGIYLIAKDFDSFIEWYNLNF